MNGLGCSPRELLADALEPERSGVGFMVYPNPADEQVTIEHFLPEDEGYSFQVINALGQTELEVDLEEGVFEYEWETKFLQQGLYYVFLYKDGLLLDYKLLSVLH